MISSLTNPVFSICILFFCFVSNFAEAQCEFQVTCKNVDTIRIAESFVYNAEKGQWTKGYASGVILAHDNMYDLENTINMCQEEYTHIKSGKYVIIKQKNTSIPLGGWFSFADESLEVVQEKANRICAEKVDPIIYK